MKIIPTFITAVALFFMFMSPRIYAERSFAHPGALNSKSNLDFVKAKIAEGVEPWAAEFKAIKASPYATRKPNAVSFVNEGNKENSLLREDAQAAYAQALLWYVTGDVVYAQRAINILNAWESFQGFNIGTDQDKLHAGWVAVPLANAADIMRAYQGWNSKNIEATRAMFIRAFYPHLTVASHWNGNVDLTQIAGLMSIAVFMDDGDAFQLGLNRINIRNPAYIYLKQDGKFPHALEGQANNVVEFWFKPKIWVDGLTQETCRDNGHHAQFGLASSIQVAEIAWNQGVDVYQAHAQRYVAALELLSSQLLQNNVNTCVVSKVSNTRLHTWEVGYHHFHGRLGMQLPHTRKLIEAQIRNLREPGILNINYELLTHGSF